MRTENELRQLMEDICEYAKEHGWYEPQATIYHTLWWAVGDGEEIPPLPFDSDSD